MIVYLVRHGKAGDRATWEGDDAERPLTAKGWEQAQGIADQLAPEIGALQGTDPADAGDPVASGHAADASVRIVSSPFRRCRQTVEPLADRLGVDIESDDRLAEGAWPDEVLELLDELPDGSVCCSHGDVIPATIAALERRGVQIGSAPDWRKGSTWMLSRSGGAYVSATVRPPP